jgi:beta-galactosidase
LRSLGEEQTIYLNGRPIAREVRRSREGFEVELGADLLRPGTNGVAVVAGPMRGSGERNERERSNPGLIRFTTPSGAWKRSRFNGVAQLIVQSTGKPGEITVTAGSPGLSPALGKIQAEPAPLRPAAASR